MPDIYNELGVRPFINAGGWNYTRYGGSIMPEEVLAAMFEASRQFVNIYELQDRVGSAIARMTGNEGAFVSCGAASGILLAVAACMAGVDEARASQLPDTTGMRNQVVMFACSRGTEADCAIRAAGATIVNVGTMKGATEEQFVAALNDRTAAVLLLAETPHVARLAKLAHARGVPVLVDGAASVPPKENLWRYTRELGCDAFITSGGKGIRGPQSTGLVLGKQAIIDGCKFHSSPNLRIGRGMKVGKEEFAGIYVALKLFVSADPSDRSAISARMISHIAARLSGLAGVRPHVATDDTEIVIEYDPAVVRIPEEGIEQAMLRGEPPVLLRVRDNRVTVRAALLQPGEERLVADRLWSVLNGNRCDGE